MPSYIELNKQSTFPSSSNVGNLIFGVNTSGQATFTDSSGNTTTIGGNASLITLTKSNADILISSSALIPSQYYLITSASSLYGNTDIVLQAATTTTLSQKGLGIFYNPKYENYYVWNNVDRINITGEPGSGFFQADEPIVGDQGQTGYLQGIPGHSNMSFIKTGGDWTTTTNITGIYSGATTTFNGYNTSASYSIGDKVIWGGKIWQNLTGVVGDTSGGWPYAQMNLDNTNWAAVSYNTTDYDLVCDEIEYDYANTNISYRKHGSNEVRSDQPWFNSNWGYNNIDRFPWGHPGVNNVNIFNSYLDSLINFPNQGNSKISNVSFDSGGGFNAHYWGWGTIIEYVTSDKGGHMTSLNLSDGTYISNIKLNQEAYFYSIYTPIYNPQIPQIHEIELSSNSTFESIYLYPGTEIYNIKLDISSQFSYFYLYGRCSVSDIYIGIDSYFTNINLTYFSSISSINIGMEVEMSDLQLTNNGCYIQQITLENNAIFNHMHFNGSNSSIVNFNLGAGSYFTSINLDTNSQLAGFQIGNGASVDSIQVQTGNSIQGFEVGPNVDFAPNLDFISTNSFSGLILTNQKSNIPITLDISNSTSINPPNYAGIVTLTSSNSTETITYIYNSNLFPTRFIASGSLTVTFNGTPVSSLNAGGQLIMPYESINIVGTKYDYVDFDTVYDSTYTYARYINKNNYV